VFGFAGLDGDGALAAVGGEGPVGGVALAQSPISAIIVAAHSHESCAMNSERNVAQSG
jgi:hypothetical protein